LAVCPESALTVVGEDGESLACFACSGRFDRGVQRQQIGLSRDRLDQGHDLADLLRRMHQPFDHGLGSLACATAFWAIDVIG